MNLSKFSKAVSMAGDTGTEMENAILISSDQLPGRLPDSQRKSCKLHLYLKPSEYETFISLIGRDPVSNRLRDLVLDFIRSRHD